MPPVTTLDAHVQSTEAREVMRRRPMSPRQRRAVRAVRWVCGGAMVVLAIPAVTAVALAVTASAAVSVAARVAGGPVAGF